MSSSQRMFDNDDVEMDISSSRSEDLAGLLEPQGHHASSSEAGHDPVSSHRPVPSAIDSNAYHFSAAPSPDSVPFEILATENHPIDPSTTAAEEGSDILGFEGITSSMPSDFEDLEQFGHHSLSEVDLPRSMGATGDGFPWNEEMGDIFTFGVSESGSLMHHPEIGNPVVDEADGTHLPDSSSSSTLHKKGKPGKLKNQPSCSSSKPANLPPSQHPKDFAESGNSPFIHSPFSFEGSDSELDQCTSSSDLFIVKKKGKQAAPSGGKNSSKKKRHRIKTEPGKCPSPRHPSKVENILPNQPVDSEDFLAENERIGHGSTGGDRIAKGNVDLHLRDLPESSHPESVRSCGVSESLANPPVGPSHGLQIEVDNAIATVDTSVPGGSRVHCFPSDILKTVSPPKRSATIMSQPQPLDAQLAGSLVPDTPAGSVKAVTDNQASSVNLPGHGAELGLRHPGELENRGYVQVDHSSTPTSLRGSSSQGLSHQSHPTNNSKRKKENHVSSSDVLPPVVPAEQDAVREIGTPAKTRTLQLSTPPSESVTLANNSRPVGMTEEGTINLVQTEGGDGLKKGNARSSKDSRHLSESAALKAHPSSLVTDASGGSKSSTHSMQQSDPVGSGDPVDTNKSDVPGDAIPSHLEEGVSCPNAAKTKQSCPLEGDVPPGISTSTDETGRTIPVDPDRATPSHDSQHNGDDSPTVGVDLETVDVPSSDDEGGAGDSDVSTSDIDDLLEQDLPTEYTNPGKGKGKGKKRSADGKEKGEEGGNPAKARSGFNSREPTEEEAEKGVIAVRTKRIFVKRGRDPLDGLPQDWIGITHHCGLDVYMHRPTRVCTWSRPYCIGEGSARKHSVPSASIRCLHYKRAKEGDMAETGSSKKQCPQPRSDGGATTPAGDSTQKPPSDGSGDGTPLPTVNPGPSVAPMETETQENGTEVDRALKNKLKYQAEESLSPEELHEYVKKLFDFKCVPVRRFKTWAERRNFYKEEKGKGTTKGETAKDKDRPKLPLVPTFEATIQSSVNQRVNTKKELAISVMDKTPVSILHEYCQRVLRVHPRYVIEERNNVNFPFEAVVYIKEQKYGRGEAPSKKIAKNNAARETLMILIPDVMSQTTGEQKDISVEFFDHIAIDDPRVADLCIKTGHLMPYNVLMDCKRRMFGQKDTEFNFSVSVESHIRVVYRMSLGQHTASGPCKNAKVGKQLGAQKILQQIYPNVKTWGGILRIFGRGVEEIVNSKKEEEREIFALSHKQKNKPNEKILDKLRQEMRKAYGAKIQAELAQPQPQANVANTQSTTEAGTSSTTT